MLHCQPDPKKNYTLIDACDVILGDLSKHVIDNVLKLKRPALNLGKLALMGKGNTMFQKAKDPLEKLDS